jgi:hypothetical protein
MTVIGSKPIFSHLQGEQGGFLGFPINFDLAFQMPIQIHETMNLGGLINQDKFPNRRIGSHFVRFFFINQKSPSAELLKKIEFRKPPLFFSLARFLEKVNQETESFVPFQRNNTNFLVGGPKGGPYVAFTRCINRSPAIPFAWGGNHPLPPPAGKF